MNIDRKKERVYLVKQGKPVAIITTNESPGYLELKATKELQKYVEKLTGVTLEISKKSESYETETVVHISKGADGAVRKPGGYSIISQSSSNNRVVSIKGVDAIGTLYGTYALIEKIGVTFLLSGDLLPSKTSDLMIESINETQEPAFSKRGFIMCALNLHNTIYDTSDYLKLMDQMVKLRFNFLTIFNMHGVPWINYNYKDSDNLLGDVTDQCSGYLALKSVVKNYETAQIKVGAEHFTNRKYMAPMVFQDTPPREDAIIRYSGMLHDVFAYAKKLEIGIGLAFDSNTMAPSFARFARKRGPRPHDGVYGSHASPTDPIALEIGEQLIDAVVKTYPEVNNLYIFTSEGFGKCTHPDSLSLYKKMGVHFKEALETVEKQWSSLSTKFNTTPEEIIDTDIGMIEIASKLIEKARKKYPHIMLGMGFFFRGYLLSSVDKLVSRDISFIDWQSSGVFPLKGDINAEYFASMGERERMIIPRIDDDGSMFGMPFYLEQYKTDGLFKEAYAAGVTGFAGQLFRERGTEHHTRFLSEASWDVELTPESFYGKYARSIFGEKSKNHMIEAFRILEENERELGWRGKSNFSWGGGSGDISRFLNHIESQENLFDGPNDPKTMAEDALSKMNIFTTAVSQLKCALEKMKMAKLSVSIKGRQMLDYLISKTEAYKAHLETIILLNRAIISYAEAFIGCEDDEIRLAEALDKTVDLFERTCEKAYETSKKVSEHIDHPNDLAILFLSNVLTINKVEKIYEAVKLVSNYHHGLPYWKDNEEKHKNSLKSPL